MAALPWLGTGRAVARARRKGMSVARGRKCMAVGWLEVGCGGCGLRLNCGYL